MRWVALVGLAACGSSAPSSDKPPIEVTMTFTVDAALGGKGPSPLDVLAGQQVGIDLVLSDLHFGQSAKEGCKTQTVYVTTSERTASGAMADTVQSMILDPIDPWDVDVSVCDDGSAFFQVNGDTDLLNTRFICAMVDAETDADGFPFLSTFVATDCSADILDVVNNRDLTASGFAIELATASAQLPD